MPPDTPPAVVRGRHWHNWRLLRWRDGDDEDAQPTGAWSEIMNLMTLAVLLIMTVVWKIMRVTSLSTTRAVADAAVQTDAQSNEMDLDAARGATIGRCTIYVTRTGRCYHRAGCSSIVGHAGNRQLKACMLCWSQEWSADH